MRRRTVFRWLTVAAVVSTSAFASLAAPLSASASPVYTCRPGPPMVCEPFAGVKEAPVAPLGYQGWTYLNLNYCAPGAACIAMYRETTVAWAPAGTTWTQMALRGGWVYVWPYTGEWRWAWTDETGWVAVTGQRFELPIAQY